MVNVIPKILEPVLEEHGLHLVQYPCDAERDEYFRVHRLPWGCSNGHEEHDEGEYVCCIRLEGFDIVISKEYFVQGVRTHPVHVALGDPECFVRVHREVVLHATFVEDS